MKRILIIFAAAALIACAFGCNKDANQTPVAKVAGVSNSVATVDGLTISNKEYQTFLHNNFGSQAITALCQTKILEAWAKDEGVTPTKEQIEKEIQKLKDEGQYEDAIEQLGEDGIKDLIKEQLLRTNISKKIAPPTKEEIEEGYKNFKSEYSHGPRKQAFIILGQDKATMDEVYKKVEGISDAAEFEKKAKELSKEYSGEKAPRTGTLPIATDEKEDSGAPTEIVKAVKSLKVNETSKVGEIKGQGGAPSIYYIIKIKKEEEKIDKKLDEVKDEVTDKVALYNSMSKPEFNEALAKRTEKAEITINIPKFKDLAEDIKKPAPMMPGSMPVQPAPAN